MTAEDDARVVAYYTTAFRESDRLTSTALGRLEFARTTSLLRQRLPPPPARVVDVGGGTGPYARWLRELGYDVDLFDLVPAHVAAIAAAAPGIRAAVADARDLPLADHTADAVLLLGPLYHLVDAGSRAAALREAARVTRPGSVLAAAAIGRYAEVGGLAVDGKLDGSARPAVAHALDTGVHDVAVGFTTAYFHTVDGLADEVAHAGWTDVRVFGVEGPTWHAVRLLPPDADLTQHVRAAEMLDDHPATAAMSSHLLAVATRL